MSVIQKIADALAICTICIWQVRGELGSRTTVVYRKPYIDYYKQYRKEAYLERKKDYSAQEVSGTMGQDPWHTRLGGFFSRAKR